MKSVNLNNPMFEPVEQRVLFASVDVQNYINVQDYGTVGDGQTDDAASIQSALDTGRPDISPSHDVCDSLRQEPCLVEDRHFQITDVRESRVVVRKAQQDSSVGQLHQSLVAQLIFTRFIRDRSRRTPGTAAICRNGYSHRITRRLCGR